MLVHYSSIKPMLRPRFQAELILILSIARRSHGVDQNFSIKFTSPLKKISPAYFFDTHTTPHTICSHFFQQKTVSQNQWWEWVKIAKRVGGGELKHIKNYIWEPPCWLLINVYLDQLSGAANKSWLEYFFGRFQTLFSTFLGLFLHLFWLKRN